ncbi:MAG: lamin tail domain-containing protein [Candidatus Aenigmarchaeota archaeon]|nr:lamin tail domain-containing protein [Candidatus Aenigmarchaeota archaeon]
MNGPLLASVVIVVGLVAASYVYLADVPISGNLVKTKQQTISQALQEAKSLVSNNTIVPSFSSTKAPPKITPNTTTSPFVSQSPTVKIANNTKTQNTLTPTITQLNQIQTPCSEEWSCSDWSVCQNSQQTRSCTDSKNCGTTKGKPIESQICSQSTPTQTQASQPKIVNIKFDADGDDRKKENWNTEWVEISGQNIDMSVWVLSDSANHTFVFPESFVINGLIKVKSGYGNNTQTELYFGDGPIWNNDGDTAFLKDKNGNLIDQYDYGG